MYCIFFERLVSFLLQCGKQEKKKNRKIVHAYTQTHRDQQRSSVKGHIVSGEDLVFACLISSMHTSLWTSPFTFSGLASHLNLIKTKILVVSKPTHTHRRTHQQTHTFMFLLFKRALHELSVQATQVMLFQIPLMHPTLHNLYKASYLGFLTHRQWRFRLGQHEQLTRETLEWGKHKQ